MPVGPRLTYANIHPLPSKPQLTKDEEEKTARAEADLVHYSLRVLPQNMSVLDAKAFRHGVSLDEVNWHLEISAYFSALYF